MSEDLVEVRLFPIRCLDLRNQHDIEELDGIIARGVNQPFYPIQLTERTVAQDIIPFFYVPGGQFTHPPYTGNHVQQIRYRVIRRMRDEESGVTIIYGCPTE